MTKVFLLGAQQEIETEKQVVEIGQIIQMEGYSCHRLVVYDIVHKEHGIYYKLIDLADYLFYRTEIICPLSQKFGIGYYYDENSPTFKSEETDDVSAYRKKAESGTVTMTLYYALPMNSAKHWPRQAKKYNRFTMIKQTHHGTGKNRR